MKRNEVRIVKDANAKGHAALIRKHFGVKILAHSLLPLNWGTAQSPLTAPWLFAGVLTSVRFSTHFPQEPILLCTMDHIYVSCTGNKDHTKECHQHLFPESFIRMEVLKE